MNRRHSTLAAEAQQHVVLPPARKGDTASGVSECLAASRQTKDFFADQTSQQARALRAEIERVARRPFNILITGETGTGKTYAAREIHRLSARANNPFMELNCANLPEHLVEAELFGHRKGAFTGADRDHMGLFEEADGGILFLDEIGDIALMVQNKLLRAIEEKQIKRLGTNRYLLCDVQIIAATSRNLPEMIKCGDFREDLYCRLAVLTFETAPLRERREDIPAMIAFYLREAASAVTDPGKQCEPHRIEEDAVALLCEFDYPGNIRALRNLIYELTSFVGDHEPISIDLVQFVLTRMNFRGATHIAGPNTERPADFLRLGNELTSADNRAKMDAAARYALLQSVTDEGDIILPFELCILRRGETLKQWTARAKRCSIEAARQATGGTIKSTASRLGLTRSSLKAYLHRAKRAQNQTLFDWERDPDSESSDR
ncbi:MAG: two component, sigma54 specific, transcriptional regulator, Fis family [Acidobacteria bacterium]|nr:two component, sigma54 specific, transcriptional regulator, Fis family [Acidobacteriota bacterium]